MSIYFYWGEDDYAIERAVAQLRDRALDPNWASFNYTTYSESGSDSVIEALNQAMTPAFGTGQRLVWLVNTNICQQASQSLLAELERTLPAIPETSVLLLTSRNKPDGRLKSTKLLKKYARVQEFSPIPPWKTDLLVQRAKETATEVGVKLTDEAVELLVSSVGNNTRQLFNELEKLRLYAIDRTVDVADVDALVTDNAASSLQLASAIAHGNVGKALSSIASLSERNEPALRIVATLTGQFRTWLWVKLTIAAGVRDEKEIARAAEVSNPKRIYFLRQEVAGLNLWQLRQTLPKLLELEVSLKQGAEEMSALSSKIIELCLLYR
ncbi:MAG: DNA polymerase III subunit delta [Hormoscilla sp.]